MLSLSAKRKTFQHSMFRKVGSWKVFVLLVCCPPIDLESRVHGAFELRRRSQICLVERIAAFRDDLLNYLDSQNILGTRGGTLLAVPIPSQFSEAGARLQNYVDQAVKEAQEQGTDKMGKEVTPWLLDRVRKLSGGASILSSERYLD